MQPIDAEDQSDLTVLADLAESCALEAAEHLRNVVGDEVRVAATKSSVTDLVTTTDREVEAMIIAELTAARPHDAILAEESGTRSGTSGVTWIIDPIDGTTNFVYGLAGFNVSIAAAQHGRVLAGVVADPLRRETFRATLGGGSTCNGRPLHPTGSADLAQALIGTGFSYLAERRREQARVVAHLIDKIRDIRRLGAAALDLCHVAAGRFDGYFESGLKPWDLAAGGLVASESGCLLGGLDDGPPDERLTIAAPPAVFEELRAALAEAVTQGLAVEEPSARRGWKFGRLVV